MQILNVLTQNKKTWSTQKQKQSLLQWPLAHRALVCCLTLRRDTESSDQPRKQYGEFLFWHVRCNHTNRIFRCHSSGLGSTAAYEWVANYDPTCCISHCDLSTTQINSGVIDVGTHARDLMVDLPSIFERLWKYAVCGVISSLFSITETGRGRVWNSCV